MMTLVFGTVLPWLLIAVGTWLGYQLVRQNGRILLRLEAIERKVGSRAPAPRHEAGGLAFGTVAPDFELPDLTGARRTLSAFHGRDVLLIEPDPSLARSRLNRNRLKAGAEAPDFRLPRIDGGELALADLRSGRVLLVFSYPDYGPCDELAPRLQRLHLERLDLRVLMVSRRDANATRAKATALGLSFPIVVQKRWEISLKYGMFAAPIGYLINEREDRQCGTSSWLAPSRNPSVPTLRRHLARLAECKRRTAIRTVSI
jgi:peroxiredoxin